LKILVTEDGVGATVSLGQWLFRNQFPVTVGEIF